MRVVIRTLTGKDTFARRAMICLFVALTIFALLAQDILGQRQTRRSARPAGDVELSLESSEPNYTLEDVDRGAVRFVAKITNSSDKTLVVGHPSFCFPSRALSAGIRLDDRDGKSEILLQIRKPNGEQVNLRDESQFEPEFVSHLVIPPKDSKQFSLGWFFQNARGKWDDDRVAWTVFAAKGSYVVQLTLRNTFPYLISPTQSEPLAVWTGELRSKPIKIQVN